MGQTIAENRKSVSADYAVVLLQYAEQQGIASAELLQGCDISQAALNSSDAYLSVTQFRALLNNIRRLVNEPALALRVGQRQHLATHGALGYAIMSSSSLEQAMQLTCRFIKIRNRLVRLKYFHEGAEVLTQMEVKLPQDPLHRHFVELAFSSLMAILRSIVGGQACHCSVAFSYPAPDYVDEYLRIFQTTPQFNAPANEIRFPARAFEDTPFRGDPVFAKMASQDLRDNSHGITDMCFDLESFR